MEVGERDSGLVGDRDAEVSPFDNVPRLTINWLARLEIIWFLQNDCAVIPWVNIGTLRLVWLNLNWAWDWWPFSPENTGADNGVGCRNPATSIMILKIRIPGNQVGFGEAREKTCIGVASRAKLSDSPAVAIFRHVIF